MVDCTPLQRILLDKRSQLDEPAALQIQCLLKGTSVAQLSPKGALLQECCQSALLLNTSKQGSSSRAQIFERAVAMARLPSDMAYSPIEDLNKAFHSVHPPMCKNLLAHAAAARSASSKVCQELNAYLLRQQEERVKAEQQAAAELQLQQQLLLQQQQYRQEQGVCSVSDGALRTNGRDSRLHLPYKRPFSSCEDRACPPHTNGRPPPQPLQQQRQQQQQEDEHAQQQQQQANRMGFQTARQKLATEQALKGQQQQPRSAFGMTSQPRMQGLAKPMKRPALASQPQGVGGVGGSARGGSHVPPAVAKAFGDADKPAESQFSEKVLALLGGPDGQVPPEIEKLDPKIVEMVCNEILDSGSSTGWDDIAGLENAKKLVHEIIVWPMQNPQLFKGARAPPKGLLLFGPPGTGKTLIGRAIASNINATFFSISASSLTSKWIGDGEKMVRALFAVANCFSSSVIFIDEIDSILSARKTEGEHEASRRMKTEMLVQMEGCNPSGERRVLLVGATNRPEELDEAARRRMPKQLYIPLPCAEARRQMILHQLRDVQYDLPLPDLEKVVSKTDGYSGSDMRNFIQEACQAPVRDAISQHGSAVQQLVEADLRPIRLRDFQLASKAQKASVTKEEVNRYLDYDARHGAKYVEAAIDEMDEDDW